MAVPMASQRQVSRGVGGFLLAIALGATAAADEAAVLEQLEQSRAKYTTAEAWAARRRQLQTEFLKGAGLWPLPPRPPVAAIVHSRRQYGDYSVENVALETFPGFYCTGNLYRPAGRKNLSPIVLCPHGHFKPLGRYREDQQIRSAHFARMGATVFSYSMVGWQDSRQTTHDDPRVLALQTWNSLRVLDFLAGLPRVDAERIGVTGASGGGTQTLYLALIDDRVQVSAPVVIIYPWAAPDGCRCEGGLPVMQEARTNAIELAAAVSPRPQLLISAGKDDPTHNFPAVGLPFVQHMYGLAGAAAGLRSVHLADEAHDYGPMKRKHVYEFFARHLPIEPDGFLAPQKSKAAGLLVEDLTKIRIETPEQLEVFSSAHPIPPNALSGSEAVGEAFEKHLEQLRQTSARRAGTIRVDQAPPARYAPKDAGDEDEALLFTPAGFEKAGVPKVASGADAGLLEIVVRNGAGGRPTHCRVNVVGPDGDYYEPARGPLKQYGLTGLWPQAGWGNRRGKGPIRYLGRFFYCNGTDTVAVPAGVVRVEAWKGLEYRPASMTTLVSAGGTQRVEIVLERTASMVEHQYWSGDPHLHLERRDEQDDERILALLAAEDIRFGVTLAYNEPAGPYAAFLEAMDSPQLRGLGKRSIAQRDGCTVLSGQEYRSSQYGHLNLYLLDDLVAPGQSYNADEWPPFGDVAARARRAGGVAIHAHGGYAREIYADVVHGAIDGVELLQFGVYREIGLEDWYHMLSAGFRVPATGASDYPACRKLGDCMTYVWSEEAPGMESWLRGMARGRSFFTSGPLVLLEVDGKRPGSQINKSGAGPHAVTARVRVRCEVAPVTHVQLVANGRVLRAMEVPRSVGQGQWLEMDATIDLEKSAWIAARAYSLSSQGTPDAESHTNPIYVYVNGRPPYEQSSLDRLVAAIEEQIAVHKKRRFAEQPRVVAYFQEARDTLMKIRAAGGMATGEGP
ncbi:MAG: CehA/McbA family metallohydrolase [Pirellulales bacterium]|nr:CehA/McbA family metallohydrolase [Pirellulales bacterium]